MKRAFVYIMGILTRPRQGFTLILFDAQSLSVSFLLLLASAVAWATAVFGLALAALEPWATPWLVIPSSEYYYWEALFALPVILTGWMLASGFAQLMSHRVGGGGSFEATAKLLALSIAISSLVHVIPALALAFFALGGALDAA
ncbi:MAG: hypothetical protein IH628_11995, partial [Proteobacteria bacterium]|nr:hypothetical protein [Pseudomonadota bacterium]